MTADGSLSAHFERTGGPHGEWHRGPHGRLSLDGCPRAPIYSCSVPFGVLFSMFGNLLLGASIEGATIGEEDVREVQDRAPSRRIMVDLHRTAAQAEAGVHGPNPGVDIPRDKQVADRADLHLRRGGPQGPCQSGAELNDPTAFATSPRRKWSGSASGSTRTARSRARCAAGGCPEHPAPERDRRYPGLRPSKGLPVRGQRTRTNARTRKGPRKKIVGNKRKSEGKSMARRKSPKKLRRRTSRTAQRTSSPLSTTRWSRSPTCAGNTMAWSSAGNVGFKGSRKSTPFAAQMAAGRRR